MNQALSQTVPLSISPGEADRNCMFPDVHPRPIDDLVHALRQPLSTIESLAYYLELSSEDEQVRRHLRQIRAMVERAHGIVAEAVPK